MQAKNRLNIGQELSDQLRAMIIDDDLEAGGRINEVHLSEAMGVSRTPLREALTSLVAEGLVARVPRYGFYVAPMTVAEVEQLYPIRALLDPAALQLAGLPSSAHLARLKRMNARFRRAKEPLEAVHLDDEWHLALVAGCKNPVLLGLIEQMMWRTRRYELGLMKSRRGVARATGAHENIMEHLEAGDLAGACAALEENMRSGRQPILDWLAARGTG